MAPEPRKAEEVEEESCSSKNERENAEHGALVSEPEKSESLESLAESEAESNL